MQSHQEFPLHTPMRFRLKTITNICLLLILVAGCPGQSSTKTAPTTEMSGRLDAALAMEKNTARHNTLVNVAREAAEAGDSDVVLKAIEAIDAGTAHDNLCSTCSETLSKKGKTSEATAIAKQIANEGARNNALGRIATGSSK